MKKSIILVLLPFVAAACASTGLTRQDILRHYDKVNQLNIEVADIEGQDAALLAPEGFLTLKGYLDDAVDAAIADNRVEADVAAEKGLALIEKVRKNLATAKEEFEEVLETRDRAELEGALGLFREEFDSADAELKEATSLIEQGNVSGALTKRTEVQKLYADMELKAIEKGKRAAAQAAIENAEEMEADDYAPKTYQKAVEELKLVTSVLESDRTQKEKADAHATRAIWLAGRAIAITELAKIFEDGDYEWEDAILWHQAQLSHVNEPIGGELPFDQSDAAAVQSLRVSVVALLKAIDDLRDARSKLSVANEAQKKDYEKKISDLLEKHAKQLKDMESAGKSEMARLQKEAADQLSKAQAELDAEAAEKARYEYVQKLFAEWEGDVSQQGKNVIMNVHAFDFAARSADIGAQNFGLLDKIVAAIGKFPNAKIIVTGHTDSRGNDKRNMSISLERAQSVARFLTTMGKIDASRIQAKGAGETKPIAPNNTSEGRAKNRRIEILLVNE